MAHNSELFGTRPHLALASLALARRQLSSSAATTLSRFTSRFPLAVNGIALDAETTRSIDIDLLGGSGLLETTTRGSALEWKMCAKKVGDMMTDQRWRRDGVSCCHMP